jgi:hypothetical protein
MKEKVIILFIIECFINDVSVSMHYNSILNNSEKELEKKKQIKKIEYKYRNVKDFTYEEKEEIIILEQEI